VDLPRRRHQHRRLHVGAAARNRDPARIPPGCAGAPGTENLIKPIDRTRDELVLELAQQAAALSASLAAFKERAFADVAAFVDISAEQHKVKVGGVKGNISLHSFDGRYRIEHARHENIAFDERLQAAKALVDECIADWSADSKPEIQALIQQAFVADQAGKLRIGRILELRRLDIKDERWQEAMRAIGDSIQVVGSKFYIRFYKRREGTDQYDPISLNLSQL